MQSPKKSWVCNLNHVHLQHVSLGLHLSRHPELQEDGRTLAPGRQAGCRDCRDHGGGTLEEVDANSNNPSLPCRCCDSHLLRLDDKLDLRSRPLTPSRPVLRNEEDEEDLGSPSDPLSSSVSSCSDLSLDDSPVSVYFKELPTVEASSPDHQPNIVPLEEAHDVSPLVDCGEKGSNLNVPTGDRPTPRVRDSPDSLCSSGSLGSPSDSSSPCLESPVEPLPAGSCTTPRPILPPTRPCRAPPAVPAPRVPVPELDSNCNTVPACETVSENVPPSRQPDANLNRAWVESGPPPVPPRTKRGLLGLRRGEAGKPTPRVAAPPEPELGHDYVSSEGARKNVTSFHELAQKRKRATAGPPPPAPQARKDQSDWLIVFSPDTELPPCNELTCGGAPALETADPPTLLQLPGDCVGCTQRGVTTFKELRHRKQKGPLAAKGGAPSPPQTDPAQGVPPQNLDLELPPNGHFWAPKEIPPRRKKPRPGLQPIVEGGVEEDGGTEQDRPARSLEGTPHRRDPWMPGRAERGDRSDAKVRQSQSFGAIPNAGRPRRAEADRVSAQLREQKKALLVAVSASVDKIVAHFSSAKNLVQKAQLGDSRLSPDVGYLVLGTLCPALRALVGDGLKPFQKDVITGQRPSSPWSVVEGSAKPGPHTRSLNALHWRVSRLAPLRNSQQRFHAFILGLLNMKLLEQWFSHLQRNSELIFALYLPTAFLVLSQGFCRRWAEELLLLLQPLSMLTFQLDLLFEYHHLSLDIRPMTQQAATPSQPTAGSWKTRGLSCPDLAGHQDSLASLEEGPLAQSSPLHEPQVEVPLHQRLLKWGDRLSHTLLGNEAPSKGHSGAQSLQQEAEDKRSWWEQMSRASEVYINAFPSSSKQEGLAVTRWARLRMALGDAVKEVCVGAEQAAARSSAQPQTPSPGESGPEITRPAPSCKTGSSPEGRVTQEPEGSALAPGTAPQGDPQQSETPNSVDTPGSAKGTWLGWLFGANSPGAPGCSPESDSGVPRSRRPSSWLPQTMNVLALVMKSPPVEKSWPEESWEDPSPDPLQPYRAVRALCNHAGTDGDQLSFRKGDILQVLDTVDEDWIHCCHGERQGLVPVSYTSLIL